MSREESITAGIQRRTALSIYRETVNQPDTLFSLDSALQGRLKQLREHLHDPITTDEAMAINDVLFRRRRWADLMAWLREPDVSWANHFIREVARAEEADRRLREYLVLEDEKWAKGLLPSPFLALGWSLEQIAEFERTEIEYAKTQHLDRAKSCPQCGTPPGDLEWFRYVSPPSCWRTVFSGFKTRCRFCAREVDYFMGAMGRGRRPEVPAKFVSSAG